MEKAVGAELFEVVPIADASSIAPVSTSSPSLPPCN